MENLKIKVNTPEESKEAQKYIFSLGYVWHDTKCTREMIYSSPCFYSTFEDGTLARDDSDVNHKHKYVTIQELHDMVVLKRNNIGDANYVRPRDGKLYFKSHNNRYYYMLDDEWIMSTWENEQLEPQLTPIYKEQPMKEFLVKVDGKYELKLLDVCEHPDAVEVPDGAIKATLFNENMLIFWNDLGFGKYVDQDEWDGEESDCHDFDSYVMEWKPEIIWQRTPNQEAIDAMNSDEGEYLMQGANGVNLMESIEQLKTCDGGSSKKHSHYKKDIKKLEEVDVYRVLELFEVKSHAVGHAVKKLLCSGERGAKDYKQDIQEAIDSLQRHLEMLEEDEL